MVCFVGLNPSTADASRDDPTLRRCMSFARERGFGGVSLGNLFALRATNPRTLREVEDPVGPRNDLWLKRLADEASLVVAAWGTRGRLGGRDAAVLPLLGQVSCLGVTQQGDPRHPLYVRAGTRFRPWHA